jgi:hypothetical protein
VHAGEDYRPGSIRVVVPIFVLGLLPDHAALELETRIAIEAVEIGDDDSIFDQLAANDFYRSVHAVEVGEPPKSLPVDMHSGPMIVPIPVDITTLLPSVSVNQVKYRAGCVTEERSYQAAPDLAHAHPVSFVEGLPGVGVPVPCLDECDELDARAP